ncbi:MULTISPECIES: hypothetical protein [Cyanophyceae]|uniref:Uncharacterized protein n=1 Tax=Leptolyngbya subtilissima DQ-A4 TaxID=2933933 RepID=A0ABV0K171_9CYAN|nr:hypothetical protein [Nodosilinea sp. FACHB-141]
MLAVAVAETDMGKTKLLTATVEIFGAYERIIVTLEEEFLNKNADAPLIINFTMSRNNT